MAMPHNKNLENLFNLADTPVDDVTAADELQAFENTLPAIPSTLTALDKVEAALPLVRDMSATDDELDELSRTALEGYKDLVDLGMNVDSRSAAEILSVASSMLGHAITAKTAKINKKLKMIELQLKKAKLDQDQPSSSDSESVPGAVFDRNELLAMLKQKSN